MDLRAVSIMMGTGGMGVGFQQAGIETVAFLENNEAYGRPCRLNWPDAMHTESAEEWDEIVDEWDGKVQLVYGNPPCQGLTGANRNSGPDHWKNQLFPQALEVAVRMHPE